MDRLVACLRACGHASATQKPRKAGERCGPPLIDRAAYGGHTFCLKWNLTSALHAYPQRVGGARSRRGGRIDRHSEAAAEAAGVGAAPPQQAKGKQARTKHTASVPQKLRAANACTGMHSKYIRACRSDAPGRWLNDTARPTQTLIQITTSQHARAAIGEEKRRHAAGLTDARGIDGNSRAEVGAAALHLIVV